MLSKSSLNTRARRPDILDYPPADNYGKDGSIAFVSSPSIGTLMYMKNKNQWWASKFKLTKDLDKDIFENATFKLLKGDSNGNSLK